MIHFGMEGIAPEIMYYSGVVCFFLAIFWRPVIGLYYLLPLIPIQTVRYWLNPFPLGSSVVDMMILAIVLGLIIHREPIFPKTPATRILLGLCIYAYVSLWLGAWFLGSGTPLWIDDPRMVDWKNFVTLPLVFWLAYSTLKTPAQMKIALLAMTLAVLALNRSFFDGIQGKDMSNFSEDLRFEGAMGYAGVNGLAAFEAQLIVFLLAMTFQARNYAVKLLYLANAGFALYCLMFAFSRGGYAGFMLGWCFLGITKKRYMLVLLALFLATWQAVVPASVQQRVMMTTDSNGQLEHSAELRVGMWDEAMEIFNQNPITGTGMFTYAYRGGAFRNPHNYYVQVMVEGGLIGMALFLTILWRFWRMGMSLAWAELEGIREAPFLRGLGLGLAAWMVAAAATNFFGDRWTYFQVSGYMWVLAGMVARGLKIQEEAEADDQADDAGAELESADDFQALPEAI